VRTAFINTLIELADKDPRIILIVGDLGFGVVQPFKEKFPQQFLNAGVAEQNMTGIAAGMALCGKIVFTYSIANFPVIRPLEQIRNDICYHNCNVRIAAVGGGMAYGPLGPSHHATEDIAVMRAMPNMAVVAPGDPIETRLAVRALIEYEGPAYLRLGRDNEHEIHERDPNYFLGKAITLLKGEDVTIISTGGMLQNAMEVAKGLKNKGIRTGVVSMHTIKPLDNGIVLHLAKHTSAIFTLEEHSIIGGLGSAVSEVLLEGRIRPRIFKRLGLNDKFVSIVGDQTYLRSQYQLDVSGIIGTIQEEIARI
jgi:transketolase